MIEKRPYGRTGLSLSRIALGGHEYLPNSKSRGFNEDMRLAVTPGYIGEGYGGPNRKAILSAAYDLGINIFDVTIDSEKDALGRNFAEIPPPYEVYVQTRPEGFCYSYDQNNAKMLDLTLLRRELQRGLGLIRRETIDFFNVGLLAWSIDNTPDYLERLKHNLNILKQEGLIRFAVADSFSGELLYIAMLNSGAFDALNTDLSFADPLARERVMPHARRLGLGIVAREVFFKSALFEFGEEAGITDRSLLARAALKWAAAEDADVIILGVDRPEYLAANAAVLTEPLAEEEQTALNAVRKLPTFRAFETAKTDEFLERA